MTEPAIESPPASTRRDAIDVARVLALGMVVLGHLTLAVIDREGGEVRGANLLALRPQWAWIAVAAPMPVFFAAGGWANATATPSTSAPRVRTLAGLGVTVVACWTAAVAISTVALPGGPGIVADGARLATQPLWFLAAYAPLAAWGGSLSRAVTRRPAVVLGGAIGLLAALDIVRFGTAAPGWIGWPGFFLAWGTPWLAGALWRHRAMSPAFNERRVGLVLTLVAAGLGAALVSLAGYAPALIDAVPGARSNTTPPTLYTAVAALGQVGALMVLAPGLDTVGRRWRRLWDAAGNLAVGVYVWHLSAMALCGAAVAAGFGAPKRLTAAWWLTRPVWWAAVLAVSAALVGITAGVRSRLRSFWHESPGGSRQGPGARTMRARAVAGVIATSAGGAGVGLVGPRNLAAGIGWSVLFVVAWLLLPARRTT